MRVSGEVEEEGLSRPSARTCPLTCPMCIPYTTQIPRTSLHPSLKRRIIFLPILLLRLCFRLRRLPSPSPVPTIISCIRRIAIAIAI